MDLEVFMSWNAQYADIVLPETTVFEQSDLQLSQQYIVRIEKAIEPLYEARPGFEIWSDLAQRVGLGRYFGEKEENIIKTLLNSEHPSLEGITLDRLEKEVVIRANVTAASPAYLLKIGNSQHPPAEYSSMTRG